MRSETAKRILARTPIETKIFVSKYADIVLRIHEILEAKSWTQKDLATRLGKNPSELSRWLSGNGNLTLKSISKLEAIFGEEIIQIPISNHRNVKLPSQEIPKSYPQFAFPQSQNRATAELTPTQSMPIPSATNSIA